MRGRRLEDDLPEGRLFEPMRDLPAEDSGRLRYGALVLTGFALAGDYEGQSFAVRVTTKKKREKCFMRAIHGHAMQVDAGIRAGFAALHAREGLSVHAEGLVRGDYSRLGG